MAWEPGDSLDEVGEPGEHGYGGDARGDPYGGDDPSGDGTYGPKAKDSALHIGAQKNGQTTKGGLYQDAFPDVYGVRNIQPIPTPAPSKEWSDRSAGNVGGVVYARAAIQQAHGIGSPKEEPSLLDKAGALVDDFSSIFGYTPGWAGQDKVAAKGTLASDYGISRDIIADPLEGKEDYTYIEAHRDKTKGDEARRTAEHGLNIGTTLAGLALGPLTALGVLSAGAAAARTEGTYADVMAQKGVTGGRDFEIGNMNYGPPEVVGVPQEYKSPPDWGGGEDIRIPKPLMPRTTPQSNEVQLAVAPPPTRSGPTRAQMRRSALGRARGYA